MIFSLNAVNKLTADLKVPFRMRNALERVSETPIHIALREALTNAVIHADYYGRQGIVIEKRPEKITFTNPGIFRPNTNEVFDGGISDPRNPNIFKMFALIDIGERAGSGLFNILTIWQDLDWQKPVWEEKFKPERLILSVPVGEITEKNIEQLENLMKLYSEISEDNPDSIGDKVGDRVGDNDKVGGKVGDRVGENEKIGEKVGDKVGENEKVGDRVGNDEKVGDNDSVDENITENQQKVIALIVENPRISASTLANLVGISKRKVEENISKLKTKGIIERIGPDRGGYWNVNK